MNEAGSDNFKDFNVWNFCFKADDRIKSLADVLRRKRGILRGNILRILVDENMAGYVIKL